MAALKPLILYEQTPYDKSDAEDIQIFLQDHGVDLVGLPDEYMGEPQFLGVNSSLQASYFIGASWLVKDKLPIVVRPKISKVDIAEMLIKALSISSEEEANYFSKCYKISFEEPNIETEEGKTQLTPLLVIHYITLLENVVKHGLKRDYITITENLTGKIKGHILFNQQLRQNIIPKREDRNACRYQVYTVDIPVNRLLKRTLIFADKMLLVYMRNHNQYGNLKARINMIVNAFTGVSDDIEISQVKKMPSNKLFRHYAVAVQVAKEILRRYDYSLSNVSTETHLTPPFWIDMSRLFEMYVLYLLRQAYGDSIEFQVQGTYQTPDYVHKTENMILDAKYKTIYRGSFQSKMIPDIREISGNARDIVIRKHLDNWEDEPECVIIYPARDGFLSFDGSLSEIAHEKPIKEFHKFYKIPIRLPIQDK